MKKEEKSMTKVIKTRIHLILERTKNKERIKND